MPLRVIAWAKLSFFLYRFLTDMWAKVSDGSNDDPQRLSTESLTQMGALKGVALETHKTNWTSVINNHSVEEVTRL